MNWFKTGVISHALTQWGDAATTAWCAAFVINGHEGNPVMAAFLSHFGILGFVIAKVLLSFWPLVLLRAPQHIRENLSKVVVATAALTGLVVLNNLLVIAFAPK